VGIAEENEALVREAFAPWEAGDSGPFFELVADDVHWEVIGTTPASGVFESKQALIEGAFGPLLAKLEGPLVTKLVDVTACGEKVFLQHTSHGVGTNGVVYDQAYCFAMRMDGGRIVEIRAYIDTDVLRRVLA
jgi:ketosteroid isomerase-like protein